MRVQNNKYVMYLMRLTLLIIGNNQITRHFAMSERTRERTGR